MRQQSQQAACMYRMTTLFAILFFALYMSSCASSDEEAVDEEISNNLGNNAEINSIENDEMSENATAEGEQMNNSTANEFGMEEGETEQLALGNNPTEPVDNINLGSNNLMENSSSLASANAALNMGTNIAPQDAAAAPTNAALASDAPTNTTAGMDLSGTTTTAAPSGQGVVRYVKNGAQIYGEAKLGVAVGSLEHGDHPLVWEEGEFARMQNGRFLPSANLTNQGLGRRRIETNWK